MPNLVYTNIQNTYDFAINIFKQAWSRFSSQLNNSKYFYLIQIILFTFNHLFAQS